MWTGFFPHCFHPQIYLDVSNFLKLQDLYKIYWPEDSKDRYNKLHAETDQLQIKNFAKLDKSL